MAGHGCKLGLRGRETWSTIIMSHLKMEIGFIQSKFKKHPNATYILCAMVIRYILKLFKVVWYYLIWTYDNMTLINLPSARWSIHIVPPPLNFEIGLVEKAVAVVCARWMQRTCLAFVLGFHTIRSPPRIFPQKYWVVLYVPLVQIWI